MPLLLVAAAVLVTQNTVLVAQRPPHKRLPGLWEFPGGKLEAGETPEEALIRELHEELGIEVDAAYLERLTFASHSFPEFHLLMPVYVLHQWRGAPEAREHSALRWVDGSTLAGLSMPASNASLVPVVQTALQDNTSSGQPRHTPPLAL